MITKQSLRMVPILIGAFVGTANGAETLDITVQWVVTSNTLEWPDIHVLFQNNEQTPAQFILHFQPSLSCKGQGNTPVAYTPVDVHRDGGRGTIPAFGWNHRTYRIGADADLRQHLPCTQEATVSFYSDSRKKQESIEIPLPNQLVPREAEPPDFSTLVVSPFVERRADSNGLIVRIYLRNSLDTGIMVEEESRQIVCSNDQKSPPARWDLGPVIRQGEAGPLYIAAKSWGVFLAAIHASDESAYSDCAAEIRLTGNGGGIATVEILLQPQGEMNYIFNHPVPPTGDRP